MTNSHMMHLASDPYLESTSILDHHCASITRLKEMNRDQHPHNDQAYLRATHKHLTKRLKAFYDLNELQPSSKTLALGRGSCSQRMAVLEAAARCADIGTRVRGLLVQRRFWYPRFPTAKLFMPPLIILAWPQFRIDNSWVDFDELHAPASELATRDPLGFTNTTDTLFDAITRTSVDFTGKIACNGANAACNLSSYIEKDLGYFESRDLLFAQYGSMHQTLTGLMFKLLYSHATP